MKCPKILIIDDEAPARQRLLDLLSDIQEHCPCECVGEASNGQEALDLITQHHPDILLLDVQMPGMTGIELAHHLQHIHQITAGEASTTDVIPMPAIIFVTAYDEFALKAFEVHALDYLLKPVRASRLQEAIMRVHALQSASSHQQGYSVGLNDVIGALPKLRQHFSILERNRVLLIPLHEVLFLKAEQKYVTIQTKTRSYLLEESLTSIEAELGQKFVRVHRNALVARDAMMGVERASSAIDADTEQEKTTDAWQVIVRDSKERLPISRRQWPVIKALVR